MQVKKICKYQDYLIKIVEDIMNSSNLHFSANATPELVLEGIKIVWETKGSELPDGWNPDRHNRIEKLGLIIDFTAIELAADLMFS